MEAVEGAGAAFVGPPMYAVEKMGDKVESKKFAAAAKVGAFGQWGCRVCVTRPCPRSLPWCAAGQHHSWLGGGD